MSKARALPCSGLVGLFTPGEAVSLTARNPDFDLTADEALEDWKRVEGHPIRLERPVVVLAGWREMWPTPVSDLAGPIERLTGGDVLAVDYPFAGDLRKLTGKVVDAVEARWPSGDADETVEVDVVGLSMGGLVARLAAIGGGGAKRLNIKRLFTIATPHRGANMARLGFVDKATRDMRPGSALLGELDEALPSAAYELLCYARLNDVLVGATNTAPPGRHPFWVSGSVMFSHVGSRKDPRIIADIVRRLRGEAPFARRGSAPPSD